MPGKPPQHHLQSSKKTTNHTNKPSRKGFPFFTQKAQEPPSFSSRKYASRATNLGTSRCSWLKTPELSIKPPSPNSYVTAGWAFLRVGVGGSCFAVGVRLLLGFGFCWVPLWRGGFFSRLSFGVLKKRENIDFRLRKPVQESVFSFIQEKRGRLQWYFSA